MSDVTLSGIQKAFGDNLIVEGVSLEVRSGEFLVWWDRPGAGRPPCCASSRASRARDAGGVRIDGRRV